MHVLVTGASGFLGKWLCRFLSKKGFKVHTLVRPSSDIKQLEKLDNIFLHKGDVTDFDSFYASSNKAEVLFHLAGLVSHHKKDTELMKQVNVTGTANAIELCRKRSMKLIHLSSVVAVGASSKPEVLNEDSPFDKSLYDMAYFQTKKEAEVLVQKACQKGQISGVILNPSTIYGAGDMEKQSRRVQEKVARGRFPFYTAGGVSVVDVESVVSACIKALDKGRKGERYILSGENIHIKDLFSLIAKAAGVFPPFLFLNSFTLNSIVNIGSLINKVGWKNVSFLSKENVKLASLYHWFDHQKAKEELEFSPSKAKTAIEKSIQWWKLAK